MKIPFSWLESHFDATLNPEAVAQALTRAGLEVESIEYPKNIKGQFVVGLVTKKEKHPNADRLSVCQVQVKKGDERTIVCGALNVAKDQKVVVALPGTTLPTGLEIKKAKIRDVESEGMICAEDELGIGDDHSGIIVLDDSAKVGKKLKAEDLKDIILDVEVTANRPDWLSILGVARELSAVLKRKVHLPKPKLKESGKTLSSRRSVGAPKVVASQYHLREVRNIRHNASPEWLKNRLKAVGVEPQQIAVDVTNYVLYEYGQPLHAFDADKIRGKKISVRFAKPKEKLKLLDGNTVTLTKDDIVIADAKGAIALAGIMGGESTAVTKETKNVLIEAAIFPRESIRKTSKRLGIRTDAANRFERGITPNLPIEALERAVVLLAELTGGIVSRGKVSAPFSKPVQKPVTVSTKSIANLLGYSVSQMKVKQLLEQLHMSVRKSGSDKLTVTPPVYRTDILIEADVAEEVGRMIGYHKLGLTLPKGTTTISRLDPVQQCIDTLRSTLLSLGYSETLLPSFYGEKTAKHATLPPTEHREVENPLDSSQHYLRSDVLPGLIGAVEKNRKEEKNVKLFEIGQVFWKSMKPGTHEWRISFVRSTDASGDHEAVIQDFVEIVTRVLHVSEKEIAIGHHPKMQDLRISGNPVGFITLKPLKKGMVAIGCECALTELMQLQKTESYQKQTKFPEVRRDVALLAPRDLDRFTILRQLYRASSVLKNVELFDVRPQSDASTSYAFHLHFQADDRTLSSTDIDFEMKTITRALQEKGGMIRS